MSAQESAVLDRRSEPADLTVFRVTGLSELATLARVVEVFALRSLLPRRLACEASPHSMQIALSLAGVGEDEAERLAERLRQIVIVERVEVERPALG